MSVNKSEVEGTLQIDLRLINDLLKNTFLDEVPAEQLTISGDESDLVVKMKTAVTNTDWRVIPYSFVPVKNPLFVGEVEQPGVSYGVLHSNSTINEFEFNGGTFNFLKSTGNGGVPAANSDINLKHKVPYFYLCYVINNVCKWLGYQATGDFFNHPDVEKILIDNINELNGTIPVTITGADSHLPHLTLEDFFKALIGFFNIRITLNNTSGQIVFAFKKTAIEQQKFLDLRAYRYTVLQQNYTEPQGFTLKAEVDKERTDVTEITDQITFLNGKKQIDIKAGTLRMTIGLFYTINYDVLSSERPGNLWDSRSMQYRANSVNKTGIKDFPLRFFFTKGISANLSGVYYPSGDINSDSFSLKLNGANSLFDFAHKNWLDKTNDAKTIRVSMLLPTPLIKQITDDTTLILESEGGASIYCLFEKIKFTEATNTAYVLAEIDLLMLDSVVEAVGDVDGLFARIEISGKETHTFDGYGYVEAYVYLKIYSNKLCTIPAANVGIQLSAEQINTALAYTNKGLPNQTVERRVYTTPIRGFWVWNSINLGGAGKTRINDWGYINGSTPTDWFRNFQIKPRLGYTVLPTIEIP